MNCHDARESFAALIIGELGLTEWAQVEALQGAPSRTYRAEIPPVEPTLAPPIPRTSTPPAESGGSHVTAGGGGSKQSPASASARPPPAEPPAAKVKSESTTKHSPAHA